MNFSKVSNTLYRGSRPDDDSDWSMIRQLGVRRLVSLETGFVDFFESRRTGAFRRTYGRNIEFVEDPMSDFFTPTIDQLRKFLACTKDDKLTYVHCLHGVDRTGVAVATYRVVVQKWQIADAIDEMYRFGFHRWCYGWWVPKICKTIAALVSES